MKDLSNLVNKYKPITQHQEQIVIDDFAKSIIDRVFSNLATIFPAWKHNWKSDDPNDPDKVLKSAKREWTKAFVENNISTMEQIKYGFTKARKSESDFLPSCGKFVSWCTPTAEDFGYPSEQQALRDCISYRNRHKMGMKTYARPMIIDLCKRVDWFLMNTASNQTEQKRATAHFNEEYSKLISSGYQEPIETHDERLETSEIVIDRMSPEQLEDARKRMLERLKDVRKGLAKAKTTNNNKKATK